MLPHKIKDVIVYMIYVLVLVVVAFICIVCVEDVFRSLSQYCLKLFVLFVSKIFTFTCVYKRLASNNSTLYDNEVKPSSRYKGETVAIYSDLKNKKVFAT